MFRILAASNPRSANSERAASSIICRVSIARCCSRRFGAPLGLRFRRRFGAVASLPMDASAVVLGATPDLRFIESPCSRQQQIFTIVKEKIELDDCESRGMSRSVPRRVRRMREHTCHNADDRLLGISKIACTKYFTSVKVLLTKAPAAAIQR